MGGPENRPARRTTTRRLPTVEVEAYTSGRDDLKVTAAAMLVSRLARLRAKWSEANSRPPTDCAHPGRPEPFVHITASGARYVFEGCQTCRASLSPGQWINQVGIDVASLPVAVDRRTQNPPCVVCGRFGTERHHWAPREVFGDEADHWPVAWLCRECHAEWHRVMGCEPEWRAS